MGFKSVLKTMFPYLATAAEMGGPLGVMAANAVGQTLGIDKVKPDTVEDAITTAQIKDPDALLKLQAAEQSFKLQMEKLGLDNLEALERIAAEDRASARAREISVKDNTNKILAYCTVAGFFALVTILMFKQVPQTTHDLLLVLLGVLTGAFKDVYAYFYGSSAGSAKKTDAIAQIAATTGITPANMANVSK